MKLQAPIPLFRIFDHQLARAFYLGWLGFKLDWEHQFSPNSPRYLQVSRDELVLHLSEHYGDCTPGSKILVHLDDVTALHAELATRPNPNMNPGIEIAPWGAKVLEVIDPFGNRICFNQAVKE
ncbi:glyoxalase superfamily protein [Verrucomicrobium sp. BvORR106]|uniref:glyoxalase superfamily protein n=1 Tax=Verrucomicrobium sp. BvORR106 TaxID=1403819 RepID=UPI0005718046|nr:glyoxalase superfamily protein [Verrucomicrobium sp. BvORR106]